MRLAAAATASATAAAAAARLLALQLVLRLASCRLCPLSELEGVRRDCFYDFEAELAGTPARSFHVLVQQKCNDTMLASYSIMSDCVTSRLELHGCSNGARVLSRYRLVQKAHEHLCSVRLTGQYCRELPMNLPHYVNLCVMSLFDGVRQSAMCTKGVDSRSQMTVKKSQSCVSYILDLMPSPCYFLQFNFYHIRTYVESTVKDRCSEASRSASSSVTLSILSAAIAASVLLWP